VEQPRVQRELLARGQLRVERRLLEHHADRRRTAARSRNHVVSEQERVPEVARAAGEHTTVVDLPAPFGPSRPKQMPRDTSRSIPASAVRSP